ncbi:MAG: AtpZ/AtpI family protein [Lachnospiraceae bacterium]|nr:AtpZ/AtpI family protein [Lachnospiraceae bacterium]
MIFQFGISMIVPILLCTFAGIFLDRLLSTSFIVIILFFIGAAAGLRNIYVLAKNMNGHATHLGSDADAAVSGRQAEDFAEKMDRVYRENMNEQTEDYS